MDSSERRILARLLVTFETEANDHLQKIASGLIDLENAKEATQRTALIELIFRETHSFKGAARSVNRTEGERLCQAAESAFSAIKKDESLLKPGMFDLFHAFSACLGVVALKDDADISAEERATANTLIQKLLEIGEGKFDPLPKGDEQPKEPENIATAAQSKSEHGAKTIRVSADRLNAVLLQIEEMQSFGLGMRQRTVDLNDLLKLLGDCKKEWDRESFSLQPELKSFYGKITSLKNMVERDHRSFRGMLDSALENMRTVLMLPISSLLDLFPKMVRDLSHALGKDIELSIERGEIQLDRRMLDEIKDPLIHIVRNSIDHGVGTPAEREKKKKPARGKIAIGISHIQGGKVEIAISDDGSGVDFEKLKSSAISQGVVSKDQVEQMNEQEQLQLMFASGVSTSQIITDISGRGLGLAIVREKVENLGGKLSVETQPDIGTKFRMFLPTTLATFRGILVKSSDQVFILPTTQVERVIRVKREQIKTVENRETIQFNNQAVSAVALGQVLKLAPKPGGSKNLSDRLPFLILSVMGQRIGFHVDEILGEQEVVAKRFGTQLGKVSNFSGATITGDGKVVPILSVPDLVKAAVLAADSVKAGPMNDLENKGRQKTILVVEDSITSRTLLKNALQAAGFNVKTAVDGVEGLTLVRAEPVDLVVSDIDMPRMNGLDMTSKIRSDKRTSELPVILITSNDSKEIMDRGIAVGADAYILKSGFDQSNLIDVIERLVS